MIKEKAQFYRCILNQLTEIIIFPFIISIILSIVLCKINIDFINIITFFFIQIVGTILYLIPDMIWVKRYNFILKEGRMLEANIKKISCKGGFRTPLTYIDITAEFEDMGVKKIVTQKIKVCLTNKYVDRSILGECHYGKLNQRVYVCWINYDNYIIIGASIGLPDIYHC